MDEASVAGREITIVKAYIMEREMHQVNNLSSHLRKLEEEAKSMQSKQKEGDTEDDQWNWKQ